MKKILLTLICSFIIASLSFGQTPELYINEFLASNESGLTDASGANEDWVEIYNAGNSAVDMGGMYLTDDLAEPNLWQIPGTNSSLTTIEAGGYLVFFFDKDTDEGILHIDAKLSADGEAIGLFASNGTSIDSYTFGPQLQDISEGRTSDGAGTWDFFTNPTPGEANDGPTGTGITEIPIANLQGGFYDNSVTVTLSSETPGAMIYYRMDGKKPTDADEQYDGAFTFNSTEVLRAIAYAPGLEQSEVMTHTYIVDEDRSNFVVVTMATDPFNLFDEAEGLFPNYEEEIEKVAHIQFFEPDGTLAFSQEIEIKLHGKGSLSMPQKSLKMKAKAGLGNAYFEHKIFPDEEPEKYRSFVMRQSGQDWNKTMFRDALQQNLMGDVKDLGGVIEKPDLELQSYRPGILYINGEYWGIQNVRAQMSWKYLDAHYGLDKDEVDVVEDESELKTGDFVEWDSFMEYLEDNNFSSDANYQELQTKADVDHFMDYMLHGIVCDNNDWPGNNNRHWRERTPDGKWRWFTKDLDFGFGLRPINGDWNSGDFTTNMLAICLAENSSEYYNRPPATLFLRRLMQNDGAKSYFINRAADLLNTVFEEDRVLDRIDAFEDLYEPQMQAHFDEWQSGWNGHASNVEKLRIFAEGRFPEVRGHFENEFSEVVGTTEVTIDASPEEGGIVGFSTLNINESVFPWEGIYFRGLEVPAVAKPNRGYLFNNWSGSESGSNPEILLDINSSSEELTAHFELGSTATDPIVINEINYNSPDDPNPADWVEFYNPNNFAVDISGWYFEDESDRFFGFPANTIVEAGEYLILAEDETTFASVYPNVTNVIGSFGGEENGFGLSGKGELITLNNALGVLIDAVEYDDKTPWPEEPDGNGPTLQLISPSMDNALAGSWIGFEATPGAVNGSGLIILCSPNQEFATAPGATEMQVNWTEPTGSTLCLSNPIVNITQTTGPANGSILPTGTTTISYEALDQCGDIQTCSFDIVVTATPIVSEIDCNENIVLEAPIGGVEAVAFWSDPSGITNCPLGNGLTITQVQGLPSGSLFPIGTTTISYLATDACGTQANCSFEVIIIAFPSTIDLSCTNDLQVISELGTSETVSWNSPTASTNCTIGGIVSITQVAGLPNGSLFPIGTQTITYEVVDACGTLTTCSFDVTVEDGTGSITLDCPDDINIVLPLGEISTSVDWPLPSASTECGDGAQNSNCGTAIDGFTFIGTLDDHQYYLSLDKMKWNAAQANCENYGGYLAVITDQDENEFIADLLSDKVYIGLTDANSEGNPEWVNGEAFNYSEISSGLEVNTDVKDYGYLSPWSEHWKFFTTNVSKYYLMELECEGGSSLELTQTGGPSNGSDLSVGTYTISYEAADDCDDVSFCNFTVTVEPNAQSLFIDCPQDITVTEAVGTGGANVLWQAATAVSLNCAGPVTVTQTVGLPSGSFFPIGNYLMTYEAADVCGNTEHCSFELIVIPDGPSAECCESAGSSPWKERIVNVTFGSINNPSGKDGYADFTNLSTSIMGGESYPISIQPEFSWTQYDEYILVWIDFNQDNDFNDAGEQVLSEFRPAGSSGSTVNPITGIVEVPETVTSGVTRMRVAMHRDDSADPCLLFERGEVEDYGINLQLGFAGIDAGAGRNETNEDGGVAFNALRVYPNPVKDMLTIDWSDFSKVGGQVEIYNALGERKFVQQFSEGDVPRLSLDVTAYGSGLYLVSVMDEHGLRSAQQVLIR